MTVQRGLSRDINSDPYTFADAGAYTPKPSSLQDAISNISAKYTMPNVPSGYVSALTKSEPTVSFADAIAAVNAGAKYQPPALSKENLATVFDPYFVENYYYNQSQDSESIQDLLDAYADQLNSVLSGVGGGSGSATSSVDKEAYAKALNQYIESLQSSGTDYEGLQTGLTERYAGYNQRLADMVAAATARQEAATARAQQGMSSIDPQAAFQFNVSPATIGAGSASDYLKAIGASTAGVEGLRGFEQSLLNQALSGAQQYSAASQQALDTERAAREAAAIQIAQEAANALSGKQLAYGTGLAEAERSALESLLASKESERQAIANAVLKARLSAAEAGVTL